MNQRKSLVLKGSADMPRGRYVLIANYTARFVDGIRFRRTPAGPVLEGLRRGRVVLMVPAESSWHLEAADHFDVAEAPPQAQPEAPRGYM